MLIPRCGSSKEGYANNPWANASIDGIEMVPKTMERTLSTPRNSYSSAPSYTYQELLPCLSNCRKIDRSCPAFMELRCPNRVKGGNDSYAFGGNKIGKEEGEEGGGDEWGGRWCNGWSRS